MLFENINNNLESPYLGLAKGNLFKNEYLPYKNYQYPQLNANNQKEELILNLSAYSFAITDLNLYLDLHPDDQMKYELLQKYVHEYEMIKNKYVSMYGPIEIKDVQNNTYLWSSNEFPWEKEAMYV